MARPKKRADPAREGQEATEILATPDAAWILAPSPVRLADGDLAAIGSPARVLQAELAASFAENAQSDRLPPGPLVLALVIGSLTSWAAVVLALPALV